MDANFPIPDLDSGVILSEPAKSSAFIAGGVEVRNAPLAATTFATLVGKFDWKEHAYGDEEDKTESDTSLTKVPVTMRKLYHAEFFDKDLYTPQSAAMELIRRFPTAVPAAIDEYIATETAKLFWSGFTATPGEIDGTAESFLEAQDALTIAGYEPTLSVWANRGKSLVRSMLNEDTNRSDVAVPVVDGISVGDTKAYFRRLFGGPLTDGARVGYLLDPAYTKIFLQAPKEVSVVTNDVITNQKNAFYAKIEFGIGIATVQSSVMPLNAKLSA